CNSALGLEDLRIQDSQLTAQSHYESLSIGGGISVDTEAKCARLNKNNCAWCAPRGNGQYLQVDLRRDFVITGIATQGLEALSDYYVRRYTVSHSRNGHTWSTFPDSQLTAQSYYESLSIGGGISIDTEPKCARLNKNNCAWCAPRGSGQYLQLDLRHDVKITGIATQGLEALSDYYVTRYKVSHSRDGHTWSILPCNSALGLEDLRIKDSQLTAQSYYESLSIGGGISVDTEPKCARLNKNNCAWCAPHGNGQYLQVDLRHDSIITGIATQGLEALSDYYVRRYKVSHSRDGYTWSIFPLFQSQNGSAVVMKLCALQLQPCWHHKGSSP
ncbi:Venom prothrombin activator omicarin-C non-catalytic subunit, partial [Acropora cervicornis]